jgi:hypothetical protein
MYWDGPHVFLSTNNGTNWTPFDTGLVNRVGILSLIVSDTHIFACRV